jgi:sigma-B regulation protein RsbU (phosphoserine phosphatase)
VTAQYIISLIYLTFGIIIILLGLIILKENFRQRINRITGLMMFFAGTGPIFGAFGLLLQASPLNQFDLVLFRKIFLVWEFFFPQMLLFSFIFPQEIKWIKRHRYIPFLIYFPHVIHFLLVVSFSSPEHVRSFINLEALVERFGLIIQPLNIIIGFLLSILSLIYRFHTNFFALINLIYIITAIILMLWSYQKLSNPRLKQQVRWVLWGIRASVGLYAIAFIFPHLHLLKTTQPVAHLMTSIALLIGAGSIAWAIVRYQFLDIQLIIRRSLVFSLAFSFLIGFYLLLYTQGKKVVSRVLETEVPFLEIMFIIIALLIFQPILSAIERLIERIFIRDSMDYRNVLNDLSRDILTTLDMDTLKQKITSTLQAAMSLENVELLLANPYGAFSFYDQDKMLLFEPGERWIQELKLEKGPIGFEELSLRVGPDPSFEKIRNLNPSLLIPFVHRDKMVGILVLGGKITKTSFTSENMTILTVLSNQAAIAIENASLYQENIEKQLMEEEIGFAREIQKNLLPNWHPAGETYEISGYNLPSKEVGGDYYDFITLNDHSIGIAIGDISGKGIPAAMLMSNLQAAFRISAVRSQKTCDVIQAMNVHISQTTSAEKFATFFYGVFDSRDLTFKYTNAGHNFPILWRPDESYSFLREGGVIMGILKEAVYESAQVKMKAQDVLVLYTDGITEALNPMDEEYGVDRLLGIVEKVRKRSAQEILDRILESVIDFTHGHLQTDDLTLVVLKVK